MEPDTRETKHTCAPAVYIIKVLSFFTRSVLIKPISSLAELLGLYFLTLHHTTSRDAPLIGT